MKELIEAKKKDIRDIFHRNIFESKSPSLMRCMMQVSNLFESSLTEAKNKGIDEAIKIVHANDPYSTASERAIEKLESLKDKQ